MQRLRESEGLRWLALILMAVFTTACSTWQPVEGPGLPDRVRVITTVPDTVELEEPRAQGDSILSGRDVQTDAIRIIPTESVVSIERKKTQVGLSVLLVTGVTFVSLTALLIVICLTSDGGCSPAG